MAAIIKTSNIPTRVVRFEPGRMAFVCPSEACGRFVETADGTIPSHRARTLTGDCHLSGARVEDDQEV